MRIGWIDWAKALAVTTVVFCHLSQPSELFYFRYLQACIITIFFFISGYLKRDRGSHAANWRKYWQGLIVPYILLNMMVYPYWLLRFTLQHSELPTLVEALRPITGMLFMEHESAFAVPLNGPLWYLPAILFMHVLTDWAHRTRHEHTILLSACVLSAVLYAANKYWAFLPQLTPMGIMRRLPYFYLGYVMSRYRGKGLLSHTAPSLLAAGSLLSIAASLVVFYFHLHEQCFPLHIALFYPVNLGFLAAVCLGCRVLALGKTPTVVTRMSEGTLVVIGFHAVLIGVTNYIVCAVRHVPVAIYNWQESLLVAILIVMALYPVILLIERCFPWLIGRKKHLVAGEKA